MMKTYLRIGIILAGVLAFGAGKGYADTQTLTVDYTVPASIAAEWNGDDTVAGAGGDGTITLDPAATKTGTLKVKCNASNGYSLAFQATNGTGDLASKIMLGAGGTSDTEIAYTVTLDVSQFSSTSNITTQAVHLASGSEAVRTLFDQAGNTLPTTDALANQVKLVFTLGSFTAAEMQEGLYTDTIVATITVQ